MSGLHGRSKWRWSQGLLSVVSIWLLVSTVPTVGYFLGDTKAVLNGCNGYWTLQNRASMPLLYQMTICVDIRVVIPGSWVAFSYSTVHAPRPELGLEGDGKALYAWLLRVRHRFPVSLSPLQWHRVCLKRDVHGNTFSLQVDEVLVAKRTVIAHAIPPSGSLWLGCGPRDRLRGLLPGIVELYMFRMWPDLRDHGLCEDGSAIGWNANHWGVTSPGARLMDPQLMCDHRRMKRHVRGKRSVSAFPIGMGRLFSPPPMPPVTTTLIPASRTQTAGRTNPHSSPSSKRTNTMQHRESTLSPSGPTSPYYTLLGLRTMMTTSGRRLFPTTRASTADFTDVSKYSKASQPVAMVTADNHPITTLSAMLTTPAGRHTSEPPLSKCDFSQLCSGEDAYFWMSIRVSAQQDGTTEQQVDEMVSEALRCDEKTADSELCTGNMQLQVIEVTCNNKTNISQTNCNVLLQLSQVVSVCELQRFAASVLQQAGSEGLQATILGEVERVGRSQCQGSESPSGRFVRCTSSSPLDEVCQGNEYNSLSCSLVDPNLITETKTQSCSSETSQFCDCTAFCDSNKQFYATRLKISSATVNVSILQALFSRLPCETSECQKYLDIYTFYKDVHLECHGTSERLTSCMVITEMSGAVDGCLLSELVQRLVDSQEDVSTELPLTRMVVCGSSELTVDAGLASNLTWSVSDQLISDVCPPTPIGFNCNANQTLAVLLSQSCSSTPASTAPTTVTTWTNENMSGPTTSRASPQTDSTQTKTTEDKTPQGTTDGLDFQDDNPNSTTSTSTISPANQINTTTAAHISSNTTKSQMMATKMFTSNTTLLKTIKTSAPIQNTTINHTSTILLNSKITDGTKMSSTTSYSGITKVHPSTTPTVTTSALKTVSSVSEATIATSESAMAAPKLNTATASVTTTGQASTTATAMAAVTTSATPFATSTSTTRTSVATTAKMLTTVTATTNAMSITTGGLKDSDIEANETTANPSYTTENVTINNAIFVNSSHGNETAARGFTAYLNNETKTIRDTTVATTMQSNFTSSSPPTMTSPDKLAEYTLATQNNSTTGNTLTSSAYNVTTFNATSHARTAALNTTTYNVTGVTTDNSTQVYNLTLINNTTTQPHVNTTLFNITTTVVNTSIANDNRTSSNVTTMPPTTNHTKGFNNLTTIEATMSVRPSLNTTIVTALTSNKTQQSTTPFSTNMTSTTQSNEKLNKTVNPTDIPTTNRTTTHSIGAVDQNSTTNLIRMSNATSTVASFTVKQTSSFLKRNTTDLPLTDGTTTHSTGAIDKNAITDVTMEMNTISTTAAPGFTVNTTRSSLTRNTTTKGNSTANLTVASQKTTGQAGTSIHGNNMKTTTGSGISVTAVSATQTPNNESKEQQADELLGQTQDASQLNSSQIELLVSQLEKILEGPTVSKEVGQKAINIISNMMKADKASLSASATRILKVVDKLGVGLTLSGNDQILPSDSLVLVVTQADGSNFAETSVDIIDTNNVQVRDLSRSHFRTLDSSAGSVFLPSSLTDALSPEQQLMANRVQFTFYTAPVLFQDQALKNQTVVSPVLACSVSNLSISNLKEDIQFTIRHAEPIQTNFEASCVFWDFGLHGGSGGWSSDGCSVVNSTAEDTICSCSHLTSFAILLDLSRGGITDKQQALILTFITYIGCGISAIFLSVTLLTYLAFDKLLRDIPAKILVQLCTALFFLNMVYLLDGWLALYTAPGLCISTGFFLHYFLLSAFTWTGLEALHMYLSIVQVFTPYLSRYMLKFSLMGWGLPLIVVVIIIAVDKDNYGLVTYGRFNDGTTNDFCWLRNDIAFYVGVVAYFLLIFVLCLIVFTVVMVQLSRIKRQNPQNQSPNRGVMADVRSIAGLVVLLGLTWGFALFAWGPLYLPFVYLFSIFNSLQGFFIFVFHCAYKENVRRQWRTYLCCGRLAENSEWSRTQTSNTRHLSTGTATTSLNHLTSRSTSVNSDSTNSSGSVFGDSGISETLHSDVVLNEIHRRNLTQQFQV